MSMISARNIKAPQLEIAAKLMQYGVCLHGCSLIISVMFFIFWNNGTMEQWKIGIQPAGWQGWDDGRMGE